jgi:hypothetical protein
MIEPIRSEPQKRNGSRMLPGFIKRALAYIVPFHSDDPERTHRILTTRLQSIDGAFRNPRGIERNSARF